MKQIKLAKSLSGSAISLGCMRIANLEYADCEKLVLTALDCGIDYFDHADIYGRGKSELLFGEVLKKNKSLRGKIKIQTKCGIVPGKMYDFSAKHIVDSVDGSLSRLGIDSVDALLLHRPDVLMDADEIGEAFDKLYDSGKVKTFGVSNFNPMQTQYLRKKIKHSLFANQLQLSVAFSGMIDSGINVNTQFDSGISRDGSIFEYCKLHDIIIQAWSPFNYGFFEGIFIDSEKYAELNKVLQNLADKYSVNKSAIAIAWLLKLKIVQPILGTTKPNRVIDSALGADINLTREEWYSVYLAAGNKLP